MGDDLPRAIRRLANRDGTSLNRAAVKLLRRGAARQQVSRIVRDAEQVLPSAAG